MFNLIDVVILIFFIFLVWQGLRTGFIGGVLNVITTITSFILATFFYRPVGEAITYYFKVNENIALVTGFFIILIISEIFLSLVFTFLYSHFVKLHKKSNIVAKLDKYLGIFPSVLVGLFLVSLLMLLVLTLPVKAGVQEPIQRSWWGRNVVLRGSSFVPIIEEWLTRTPYKNLVYLVTPTNPDSKDSRSLNLPATLRLKPDPSSEQEMLKYVNKERLDRGLQPVVFDNSLRDVGRAHCEDMFKRKYFSHYTPEGKDPFQRMDEAEIEYLSAGENLAYAPSVPIAHDGLMNSPGHKENILRPAFRKLGIGVIDAGVAGKMFCQEFTN